MSVKVEKVEKIEKNVVEMEVSVEAEKFSSAVNSAAKQLAHKVSIPGFRKGKAPRRLVEQTLGTDAVYNEALDRLLGPAYAEAVVESGIDPVDRPDVDLVQIEEGKDLIFKAKVTVKPEVELGEYKGLSIEQEGVAIDDMKVEEDLQQKQEQHARLINIEEGTVEQGDTASIDFEGFVDGVAFPGGKGENYGLVIGSGTFIPGFEEQLVGAEIGQEVEVNVKFPDEYHSEDLAGKEALFKAKIHKIQRKELAPLDDEFAKDVSNFETLEELKEDIRKRLIEAEEKRVENAFRNAVVAKAVDNASVEIPEVMIDKRVEAMVHDLEHNLAYQGLNLEQYYAYTNSNEEDMRERFRPQAAESVKTELVLEAAAKAEGIQVSEDELNEELEKLGELYKQDPKALKESLAARGELDYYRQSLINDKTVKFLVEQNA